MDEPKKLRPLRLPDDHEEQEHALKQAKLHDPEADIIRQGPPIGAHLRTQNETALLAAKLSIVQQANQSFKT